MQRSHYRIFSTAQIGRLTLSNRLVRSATEDPAIWQLGRVTEPMRALYSRLAAGGVGLIVTGDFPVVPQEWSGEKDAPILADSYAKVRVAEAASLPEVIHRIAPECKVVAQLSPYYQGRDPSAIPSPFAGEISAPLTTDQIKGIAQCIGNAIVGLAGEGFDGIQLHAAHGGLLCRFLSPYTNRREDEYGGSVENRARIIREAIAGARAKVGDFPILIKMNCTDYLEGGVDAENFPALAAEVERCGVDAIEISGGMWDCLVRTEAELGFRPIPSPESHTRIKSLEKQSYFRPAAESLRLSIPVILTGGNRDIERLEKIIRGGKVDFIGLCRPLIREPDLPRRWLEGRGSSSVGCISCNSCIYDMRTYHQRHGEPWVASCLVEYDRAQVKEAQHWLATLVGDLRKGNY